MMTDQEGTELISTRNESDLEWQRQGDETCSSL